MGNVCENCKCENVNVHPYPSATFIYIDGHPHIGPSHIYLCDKCVEEKRKRLEIKHERKS